MNTECPGEREHDKTHQIGDSRFAGCLYAYELNEYARRMESNLLYRLDDIYINAFGQQGTRLTVSVGQIISFILAL